MVYLYINGVASRDLTLAFISAGRVVRRKVVKEGTRTEHFLPAVVDFLKGKVPSGIVVVQGGGSFSQTRIVCAIANALAYGWGIKVAGVSAELSIVQVAALPKFRWQRLLLPTYSGPGVG